MNTQQAIQNNSTPSQQPEEESYEEEEDDDLDDYAQGMSLKQLFKNSDLFMQQINMLNEQATVKIKQQKHKEALKLLQQSEQMLEFAASCGRVVDRNLIIIILYNQACAYQCQWVLDKCSKYLDGVIYNMEIAIKEDELDLQSLQSTQEKQAQLVKRQTFLAKAYLQYTAILSQLGRQLNCSTQTQIGIVKFLEGCIDNETTFQNCKLIHLIMDINQWFSRNCNDFLIQYFSENVQDDSQSNLEKKKKGVQTYQMKDEIEFGKLVIDGAQDILKDMIKQEDLEQTPVNEKHLLKEAKKQLYYWKNNPENNEKHLRKELKVVTQNEDYRSLLGIQNLAEWIKNFNIGSIMHMAPQIYEDFTQFGEMIYELAKRQLLEKVIYLSISYFTIATELRFIELEKAKQMGIKDDKIETEEFKLSEIYHLKSIEIACRHITSQSPYISHLITSYHKHYNVNLEVIKEESILSSASEQFVEEQVKPKQPEKFKQIQIQTTKENLGRNFEKQDQSPKITKNFIKSFLSSRSPPKNQQEQVKNLISDTVKIQTNLIEQILNQKRGSGSSPMNQRSPPKQQQKQPDFDFSVYLKKQSNPCNNTSNNNITSTGDMMSSAMTIQLQPYKTSAKSNLANLIKQSSPTSNQNNCSSKNTSSQLKTIIADVCRTERQTTYEQQPSSYTPISYRVNNRSPDQSYINNQKQKQQQIHQNKTPQNRPRTNTEQQFPQPSFPLKLETIQQLLKNKSNNIRQK